MKKVLIVGAGEIGKALEGVLSQTKGLSIKLWDKKSSLCSHEKRLEEAMTDADFVFLCVPSFAIAECSYNIKAHLGRKTVVVALTKGLERETGQFTSEFLLKTFSRRRVGILSGPMLAEELNKKLPTAAVIGSAKRVFNKVAPLFKNTSLRVEYTSDIQGVAVAGVLKNIYALTFGIADALGTGDNGKGVLMAAALEEMEHLVKRFGGRGRTALTLAGIGDLYATGSSDHSTNKALGKKIVASRRTALNSEGARSMPLLIKRLGKVKTPDVLAATNDVVNKNKDVKKAISKLILK